MNSAQVSTVVQCKNILGESCFWDPRDKCIWWTDIEGKKIWKLDQENQSFEFNLPDRAGFILPRKKDGFIINAEIPMFTQGKRNTNASMLKALARVLVGMTDEIEKFKPDLVLTGFDIGANLAATIFLAKYLAI